MGPPVEVKHPSNNRDFVGDFFFLFSRPQVLGQKDLYRTVWVKNPTWWYKINWKLPKNCQIDPNIPKSMWPIPRVLGHIFITYSLYMYIYIYLYLFIRIFHMFHMISHTKGVDSTNSPPRLRFCSFHFCHQWEGANLAAKNCRSLPGSQTCVCFFVVGWYTGMVYKPQTPNFWGNSTSQSVYDACSDWNWWNVWNYVWLRSGLLWLYF